MVKNGEKGQNQEPLPSQPPQTVCSQLGAECSYCGYCGLCTPTLQAMGALAESSSQALFRMGEK